ncbi:MAG: glycoside hydrolase family 3 C-terminal domain-containing protein [Christensenellaceae bacterium]|nr:glycoside hydrolase family 3 C-terminal domain-containing protein [Christensenellaceae bacterium]
MFDKKIEDLIQKLSLDDKAALCSGVNLWCTTPIKSLGIPSIMVADGPHGLRREYDASGVGNIIKSSIPSTCFPPATTLAGSWDRGLMRRIGNALAEEALEQGVSVLLGPGVNIKRSPLCGRNFEYFSEDPLLAGELGAAYIIGLQELGIGGCIKHYAVNSQESYRHTSSSEVDERALREIYLTAFEIAVKKSKPYTIMCCYNLVNGVYGSDSEKLLQKILRDEWGFDGLAVSDWGAVNDRVQGIRAGLDLEMPSSNGENDKLIVAAVKSGILNEERLNDAVRNVLNLVYKSRKEVNYKADYEKHHLLAREAGADGAVLMKNDDNILPIKRNDNIAVIGKLAQVMRYQGAGSSQVVARKSVSFLEALNAENISYQYADGYKLEMSDNDVDSTAAKLLVDAVSVASDKDAVILFLGLPEDYESEAFDRTHINLPQDQEMLLDAVYAANKNIAVVLCGGSPVKIVKHEKMKGILNIYLGGESAGESALDLIFGRVNPSGKLAETYPVNYEDNLVSNYYGEIISEYRESVYVGYRYYDSAQRQVLFPFGHGLSYTKFAYTNANLSSATMRNGDTLTVSVDIENIGDRFGKEIVQVYVRDAEPTIFRPEKELKGFDKVSLEPGQKVTVNIDLDKRAFAFYDVNTCDWVVETGMFQILIAASSRDIKASIDLFYESDDCAVVSLKDSLPTYYNIASCDKIPDAEFYALLGHDPTQHIKPKAGTFGFNSTVDELGDGNWFAKFFKYVFKTNSTKLLDKNATKVQKKMTRKGAGNMPVRNFFMMSAGVVSYYATIGLIQAFNKKPLRGIAKFVKELIKKRKMKKDIYT